jgi:hypothetical protein
MPGCYERFLIVGTAIAALSWSIDADAEMWRGLRVGPESRCSQYQSSQYSYPQSVEVRIIDSLGGIWSPYTGREFAHRRETDIEHIVARSEAHDSGLCAASTNTRRQFSRDLLNLTLASPSVNRHQKRDHDAAEWLPMLNRCWFADRVVRVRQKYNLTIDRREADALDRVLGSCTSLALVQGGATVTEAATPNDGSVELPAEVAQWDDNDNGRITCAEARVHGIAPVHRDHPAYPYMRDGDGDGVVCESGGGRQPRARTRRPAQAGRSSALRQYDDNGNGRITCAEARRHGIAPVRRGHPAYRYMNDRDNDGVVCE